MTTNKMTETTPLNAGGTLTSISGQYVMTMQSNGLLVIEDVTTTPSTVVFCSPDEPAASVPAVMCKLTNTGVLEIVNGTTILWASPGGTTASLTHCLILDNNGVATIYKNCVQTAGNIVWSTAMSPFAPQLLKFFASTANDIRSLEKEVQRVAHDFEILEKTARALFPLGADGRGIFAPEEYESGVRGDIISEKEDRIARELALTTRR